MNKWLAIIWGITAFIVVFIFVNPLETFWSNGTLLLGWALFSLQVTYNQSAVFYMAIKRIWFYLKNPECTWNMVVSLKGDFTREIFNTIEQGLSRNEHHYKVTEISNVRRIYQIGSIGYEIFLNERSSEMVVTIYKLELSYRRSRYIIEHDIGKFLNKIKSYSNPYESEYGVTVEFSEFNPYYGMFLRRLRSNEIKDFSVTINTENNKVAVSNNTISFHTHDLWEMSTLSKKYLTLSPR